MVAISKEGVCSKCREWRPVHVVSDTVLKKRISDDPCRDKDDRTPFYFLTLHTDKQKVRCAGSFTMPEWLPGKLWDEHLARCRTEIFRSVTKAK